MDLRFFMFLILGFTASNLYGQTNYFDDQLIIKFHKTSQDVNLKSNQIFSSIINEYKIHIKSPIWTKNRTQRLYNKKKSINNVDYNKLFAPLENTFYASFESEINPLKLAEILTNLPEVDYAEPRYIYKTSYKITDDPINNSFVSAHNFPEGWKIEQGSSDIIIGIVDSGVNYNHEDLKNKQWLNVDEIPDNGIDDDENGYVDDYLGWDFWESGGFNSVPITSDNDPFDKNSGHGTHVAGIATAEANNGVGLIGAGYNSRYMAIKVGGAADNPNTPLVDESSLVGFGYEGILYAFENDAQIINCSWGGDDISSFGEEVLRIVTEGGSLVISAAGNDNSSDPGYPSANENVLSVGAIEPSGVKASYSNYGETVDVFAVGTSRSSFGALTNEYATLTGTSMSSPVVAGLAALLKAQNPSWSLERIKFQITSTAESIDDINSGFEPSSFGNGSINAFKALEQAVPILKIDSLVTINKEGEELDLNEEGFIKLFIKNLGAFAESVSITPRVSNTNFNFEVDKINIGSINTDEIKEIEIPISLDENFSETLFTNLIIEYLEETSGFTDENIIEYRDFQFKTLQGNNIAMSFSPNGAIGFYDFSNSSGGVGFIPNIKDGLANTRNILFEGGIILQSNGYLANTLRTNLNNASKDFNPVNTFKFSKSNNHSIGTTKFSPYENTKLSDLNIKLTTHSFSNTELENVIILNYEIFNTSSTLSFSDVYLGLFNDWDIGENSNEISDNSSNYLTEEKILYVYGNHFSDSIYVSTLSLNNPSSILAIDNGFDGPFSRTQFSLYDGFTNSEKSNSLTAGTQFGILNSVDISTVVASGPFYIAPNTSISIAFVYAYGNTLNELVNGINAARNLDILEISDINTNPDLYLPDKFTVFQNYPNPFNPSTNIRFNLSSSSDVSLIIYNSLGRKILKIIDENLSTGIHTYSVNMSQYSSGIYFAQLITNEITQTIPLTLIK